MEKEKQFKVHSGDRTNSKLSNVPDTVPWGILNEDQAERNHSQSLSLLNERGGLGVLEMLNNIDKNGLDFRGPTQVEVDRLNKVVSDYLKRENPLSLDKQIQEQAEKSIPLKKGFQMPIK